MNGMARILIVEDEPDLAFSLQEDLRRQGHAPVHAVDGLQALQLGRDRPWDLILLDVMLPKMDGYDVCTALRKSGVSTPIIMLTARAHEAEKELGLDSGADDYVTKPFSTPELLARIRAALRRLPTTEESGIKSLKLPNLEINFATRRVISKGREVRLTPKEFDLLHYLVANPNVPIPHGKLLQAVWGPDYGDEVEYLRVFVNQLRKKIEPDPSNPQFLLTEPWVGYRLQLADSTHDPA